MKKTSVLLGLVIIPLILFSQTIIPGGNVNGTWTSAGSPYLIEGNITIAENDTLNITQGVEVIFQDYYQFEVLGCLLAIGAENDSIRFTEADTTGYYFGNNTGWGGITFGNWKENSSKDDDYDSELNYCIVEFGDGFELDLYDILIEHSCIRNGFGITAFTYQFDLRNCTITNNEGTGVSVYVFGWGGVFHASDFVISNNTGVGIDCAGDGPIIINSGLIKNNHNGGIYGGEVRNVSLNNIIIDGNGNPNSNFGGVYLNTSNNCDADSLTVINNTGINGGGIWCADDEGSSTYITNSLIENNSGINGGGLYFHYSCGLPGGIHVINTVIKGNNAFNGGGVYVLGGGWNCVDANFERVLIEGNYASNYGGGVCWEDRWDLNIVLTNTTIVSNVAGSIGGGIYNTNQYYYGPSIVINSSIIRDNLPEEIVVDSLMMIDVTHSNIKGGWPGAGNIDEDPLFFDPDNGNYHLSWINYPLDDYTKSPCINTGDPSLPYDPDGTITDMGAYPFDQSAQQQVILNIKAFLEGPFFNGQMTPFLNSLGFLPPGQPFYSEPWSHLGMETVGSIPNGDVIDWIFVEMRKLLDYSSLSNYTTESRQAAFVLDDGSIVGLDGSSSLDFYTAEDDSLHICLFHRNHVPIISANPISLTDNPISYDFTISEQMVMGESYSQNEISPGLWGMIAADGNADGQVDNNDKSEVWLIDNGYTGYYNGDFNMDTEVDIDDKIVIWELNVGKGFDLFDTSNTSGFICGDPLIDERDDKTYNTVLIGDQCWMAENLNIGVMIDSLQNQLNNSQIEKYCYNNSEDSCSNYGGLYQWDEIMNYETTPGTQGICPPGWHMPTDDEWKILEGNVDNQFGIGDPIWDSTGLRGFDVGFKLKSTFGWMQGGNGIDDYYFTILPAGYRSSADGGFYRLSRSAFFWSSTNGSPDNAYRRKIEYNENQIGRGTAELEGGRSVRCLKN